MKLLKMGRKTIQQCVIFTLIIMVLCGCQNGGELMEEKPIIEQYLIDKYGKQFVVEKVDYYREQLGADKRIKAIAYPEDDKDLKFEVKKMLDGKKWAFTDSEYSERYLNLLWDKQMKEKVIEEFGSDMVEVGVSAPILDIEKSIKGKTISIDEALEQNKQKISMHISCGYLIDKESELDSSWLERIYSSIEAIRNDNFENIALVIRFFNKDNEEDVKKNLGKYLKASASEYRDLKKGNVVLFNVEIGNMTDIKQPSDLQKYIDK